MEINENEVYSTAEARRYLKVSNSTMMRLIKHGLIGTAKIGKQYRIMGKELLRLVSPRLEDRVGKIYNRARRWVHEGIDKSAPQPGKSEQTKALNASNAPTKG